MFWECSGNNACKLRSVFDAQDLQAGAGGGVQLGGAAYQTDGHGHFYAAGQVAARGHFPMCQAAVVAVACCIGVCTGFDCTGVIARGHYHSGHPVHDAFVVGGGAVGVYGSELVGTDDTVAHGCSTDCFGFPDATSPG